MFAIVVDTSSKEKNMRRSFVILMIIAIITLMTGCTSIDEMSNDCKLCGRSLTGSDIDRDGEFCDRCVISTLLD